MSKQLLIFPFGGNAREAVGFILADAQLKKEWDVIGFVDEQKETWNKKSDGIKVLGGVEVFKKYPTVSVLAVVGSPNNYQKRAKIIEDLKIKSQRFATIVHPSVVRSVGVTVGVNTLIMPNVVIGANVKIGSHCIILPNTTIGHDSVIGDYSCVGSNVSIAGSVKIEENCYIGSGANFKDGLTVGSKSLVGLGTNVIKDIAKNVVVAGNPAEVIKKI